MSLITNISGITPSPNQEVGEMSLEQKRYFESGKRYERERIIALLTEVKTTWRKPTSFNYQSELERLIDLIAADRG